MNPDDIAYLKGEGFSDYEIENDLPKGSQQRSPGLQEMLDKRQAQVGEGVRSFASGATFDLMDNAASYVDAMRSYVPNPIDLMMGEHKPLTESFGERQQAFLENSQAREDQYGAENPNTDFLLRLGGGVANPANRLASIAVGSNKVIAPIVKAYNKLSKLRAPAKTIPGMVGKGALEGGAQGLITGLAQEGGNTWENALAGLGQGLGTGAVFTPAFGSLARAINAARNYSAAPDPATRVMASYAKDVPEGKFDPAKMEMLDAHERGIPLYPAEALNSKTMSDLGRRLVSNRATAEEVQDILKLRAEGAPGRVAEALDKVGPYKDPSVAGDEIKRAMELAKQQRYDDRAAAAHKIYEESHRTESPVPETPTIKAYLETDLPRTAIAKSRTEYLDREGLADTSLSMLKTARSKVSSAIEKAIVDKDGDRVRELTKLNNALNQELDTLAPLFREGDAAFSAETPAIKALENTPLGGLLRNPNTAPETYLTALADQPPAMANIQADMIRKAGEGTPEPPKAWTEAFGERTPDDVISSGVRGRLQKEVNTAKRADTAPLQGANLGAKLLGNTEESATLRSLLGEDTFKELEKRLQLENKIFQGTKSYHPGSSTAENLAKQGALEGALSKFGALAQAMRRPVTGAMDLIASQLPGGSDETMRELRKYMMPSGASEAAESLQMLERMQPLLQGNRARTAAGDRLARVMASMLVNPAVTEGHKDELKSEESKRNRGY